MLSSSSFLFRAMWRGKFEWNPGLIIAQIVAIQAAFYASLGALLILLVGKKERERSSID